MKEFNHRVFFIDLPDTVRGVTIRCYEDYDFYTIIINAKLSFDMRMRAYRHELDHICNGDFGNIVPVDNLEGTRHIG